METKLTVVSGNSKSVLAGMAGAVLLAVAATLWVQVLSGKLMLSIPGFMVSQPPEVEFANLILVNVYQGASKVLAGISLVSAASLYRFSSSRSLAAVKCATVFLGGYSLLVALSVLVLNH